MGVGPIPGLRRGSLMDRYLEALMHFENFGPIFFSKPMKFKDPFLEVIAIKEYLC